MAWWELFLWHPNIEQLRSRVHGDAAFYLFCLFFLLIIIVGNHFSAQSLAPISCHGNARCPKRKHIHTHTSTDRARFQEFSLSYRQMKQILKLLLWVFLISHKLTISLCSLLIKREIDTVSSKTYYKLLLFHTMLCCYKLLFIIGSRLSSLVEKKPSALIGTEIKDLQTHLL